MIILFAVLVPLDSVAQDSDDSWQWQGTMYGWMSDLGGTARFPTGGEGSLDVAFEDILDKLDMAFMGALTARKGNWGVFTDLMYLDLGDSVTESRDTVLGPGELPAGVDLTARLDMKSWLWTAAGLYNLSHSERHTTDLIFGARMVDMSSTLKLSLSGNVGDYELPGGSESTKVSGTVWDAVVGVKGYALLGAAGKWVLPYHFDIGTGDSDLTWQAMAGLGYQFNWGDLLLTYRYLDYDMKADDAVQELNISGPMIGASFQW